MWFIKAAMMRYTLQGRLSPDRKFTHSRETAVEDDSTSLGNCTHSAKPFTRMSRLPFCCSCSPLPSTTFLSTFARCLNSSYSFSPMATESRGCEFCTDDSC